MQQISTAMRGQGRHQINLEDCQAYLVWVNRRMVEPVYRHGRTQTKHRAVAWLIEQGHVTVEGPDEKASASAGQWLFLGTGAEMQHFSPRARLVSIHFMLRMRGGQEVFARKKSLVVNAAQYPELERAAGELVELAQPWDHGVNLNLVRSEIPLEVNYLIEGAFYRWLGRYVGMMLAHEQTLPVSRVMDTRISRAVKLIEEHVMREKFNEPALARQCGLSVNQLARLFKRDTRLSPFAYYEQRRLELATDAVSETTLGFKEIAFNLGFGSLSHFSNWFKAQKGRSPSAFRKAAG